MNINTLIDAIVNSIATDTATTSWANTIYGTDHNVFLNFDERNPPGSESTPFIVIYPTAKTVGYSRTEKIHRFEVDCCIYDEAVETFTPSNITGYAGVKRIESFRKLVESAITGTDIGNLSFSTIDIEYDTIESFPYHWAGMTIEIKERVLIASDPLE